VRSIPSLLSKDGVSETEIFGEGKKKNHHKKHKLIELE
jgi:hypothetical protein